ncbi:MAG: MerC domain-containing protein [Gemmatimonadetes bacterium]|nr:MerC domain-containing protein [Gemmatimonadota bacterium]
MHCLATPFLVVAFPVVAWLGEGAEAGLIALSLVVSTFAILRGRMVHRRRWPLGLLAAGALVLATRRVVEEGPPEQGLVVVAAVLLVVAHGLNLRWSRRAASPSPIVS